MIILKKAFKVERTKSRDCKTRVLLADVHHIVRNGIRQEIEKQADMVVVGETSDGYEAVNLARELNPDVVILDVKLSGQGGVKVIHSLNEMARKHIIRPVRKPAVLIFTAYSDKQYVWSLLASGARGYLLKSEPLGQLLVGIRQVMSGQTVLSQAVQTNMVKLIPDLNQELSATEIKVMQLLAHGLSNRDIAQNLYITEGTIKSHLNNIYRKVPWIRNRAEAIAWAWINHIVSSPDTK